jgi:hypothetical protein
MYNETSTHSGAAFSSLPGSAHPEIMRGATLIGHHGDDVILALALPLVAALAVWMVIGLRGGRWIALCSTALSWLFVLVGILSIGIFYLPSAAALTAASVAAFSRSTVTRPYASEPV